MARSAIQSGDEPAGVPKRQALWAFSMAMAAVFLTAVSQTIVATALPRIAVELGRFDQYTWTASAYAVAVTIAIPIAGGFSDRYGRRPFLLLGVALFTVASALAGMSPNMSWMVISRTVQGVGGGIVSAVSLPLIVDLFQPEDRGRHLGALSAAYGVAFLVGPPLGGVLTDALSWRWTLWINVPLGVAIMGLIVAAFPRLPVAASAKRPDLLGMAILVMALGPILLALSWGGVIFPWSSPLTIGAFVLGAAMSAAFVFVETRAAAPIMPMKIYRYGTVAVSFGVLGLTGLALFGVVILLPLFLQGVVGLSAAASGGHLSVLLVAMAVGGVASGRLISRTGYRYRLWGIAGTATTTTGILLMAAMQPTDATGVVAAYMAIAGLGFGLVLSSFALAVQNTVPHEVVGSSTAALQFARQLGGLLLLTASGPALASRFSSRVEVALPADLEAQIRPHRLDELKRDPQALMDPATVDGLRAAFDPLATAPPIDALRTVLTAALDGAVGDLVLILGGVAALSLALTMFLPKSSGQPKEM